ncbi:hypothetical protein [Solirubrum puertoriconensis]|uniref:Hemoglobin n=1 Tax=Solirubrum puertoriconensis TaxID=1751427 RepID=A0A9X0HM90_SOLP1|nr:hypothetical protein [Solirubrum puertoriconensis]KUG08544.1 hypothetical protein ASU33_10320 [Solirubrum puertoriconensis]
MPALASLMAQRPAANPKAFVHDLYRRISLDAMLRPLFGDQASLARVPQPDVVYLFWESVMQGTCYEGRPFPRQQPISHLLAAFGRWQQVLAETLDAHYPRHQAEELKAKTANLAVMLQHHNLHRPQPAVQRPRRHTAWRVAEPATRSAFAH